MIRQFARDCLDAARRTFLRLRNNMLNLVAAEPLHVAYGRVTRMLESLSRLVGRLGPAL